MRAGQGIRMKKIQHGSTPPYLPGNQTHPTLSHNKIPIPTKPKKIKKPDPTTKNQIVEYTRLGYFLSSLKKRPQVNNLDPTRWCTQVLHFFTPLEHGYFSHIPGIIYDTTEAYCRQVVKFIWDKSLEMDIKAFTLKNVLFLIFWRVFKGNPPFFLGGGSVFSVVAPKNSDLDLKQGGV